MMRKKWVFFLSAVLMLTVLVRFPDADALGNADSFTVYIAADPHYLSPELTDNGSGFTKLVEAADGKDMLRCEIITDAFIDKVILDHPDALILPGDLSFNGEAESHRRLAEKLAKIREAGIPVFVIPGNHDLNAAMAASFSGESYTLVPSVNTEEFTALYADCGYRCALSRDTASLSYTAMLGPRFRLLMLDVNGNQNPGSLSDETLLWAEEQLKQAKNDGVKVIAVSHQTLLPHSFLTIGVVIRDADPLLALYEKYGVLCNLSGHMHIQHILCTDSGFPEISGSALITWPNQIGVLDLGDHSANYRTLRIRTGVEETSETFLWNTALRQGFTELQALDMDKANTASLSEYFADVNTAYISGNSGSVDWGDPRYETWRALPSVVGYYLQLIRSDVIHNHTEYTISYDRSALP